MENFSQTMDNDSRQTGNDAEQKPLARPVTSAIMAVLGVVSAVYIFNPGAGFIELIPDNLPIVGNLDEAGAATLLIGVMAYFGLDVTAIFRFLRRFMSNAEGKKENDVIDID